MVSPVPARPPHGSVLHRGRAEKREHELERAARLERPMREVPMVARRDRPHAEHVADGSEAEDLQRERDDEDEQTGEVHRHEQNGRQLGQRAIAARSLGLSIPHELLPVPRERATFATSPNAVVDDCSACSSRSVTPWSCATRDCVDKATFRVSLRHRLRHRLRHDHRLTAQIRCRRFRTMISSSQAGSSEKPSLRRASASSSFAGSARASAESRGDRVLLDGGEALLDLALQAHGLGGGLGRGETRIARLAHVGRRALHRAQRLDGGRLRGVLGLAEAIDGLDDLRSLLASACLARGQHCERRQEQSSSE